MGRISLKIEDGLYLTVQYIPKEERWVVYIPVERRWAVNPEGCKMGCTLYLEGRKMCGISRMKEKMEGISRKKEDELYAPKDGRWAAQYRISRRKKDGLYPEGRKVVGIFRRKKRRTVHPEGRKMVSISRMFLVWGARLDSWE
jgi:hypothetical protein